MSRKHDLTGETYGRLSVIKEGKTQVSASGKSKARMWVCQCECGTVKEVSQKHLKSGATVTCGCGKREPKERVDISGQVFGKWTAIHRVEGTKISAWLCKCDCGNEGEVRLAALNNGSSTGCGCWRGEQKMDLSGNVFGEWTVLHEDLEKSTGQERWWISECSCGFIKSQSQGALTSGSSKSCGRHLGVDLVGKTFKNFTVLEEGEPAVTKSKTSRRWVCKCNNCGVNKLVYQGNLTHGSVACECQNKHPQVLAGAKYGRLTTIERNAGSGSARWSCICECGNLTSVLAEDLKTGNTKSCGCYKRDVTVKRNTEIMTKHGLSEHPLYKIWNEMVRRCHNPQSTSYSYYGARGISVCEEWRDDVAAFINWAEKESNWKEGLTIERIDVNGNYEPSNVTWDTFYIQAINTRVGSNNKSGYRGVGFVKSSKQWRARITHLDKQHQLGLFDNIDEAVEARQLGEIQYFKRLTPGAVPISQRVINELNKLTD